MKTRAAALVKGDGAGGGLSSAVGALWGVGQQGDRGRPEGQTGVQARASSEEDEACVGLHYVTVPSAPRRPPPPPTSTAHSPAHDYRTTPSVLRSRSSGPSPTLHSTPSHYRPPPPV